jgi:S-adenosylmethionine:tRNA ribosyltransferase-isomerase
VAVDVKLSDFDFKLPAQLIAQKPARPRNHARLLVYNRADKSLVDDYFYNLHKHLAPFTTMVLNDSKVEKSRLRFGATEIFILETINATTIKALVKPGKKFKEDAVVEIALKDAVLEATVLNIDDEGIRTLKLNMPIDDKRLDDYRQTPLPPYIAPDESLSEEYQTVYASPLGSKAAPTAGLHFTQDQLDELSRDYELVRLTLHVGMGTFAPVKIDDIKKHKMHPEEFMVSPIAASKLNQAKHVTAVGTTSLRVLESMNKPFKTVAGSTDIFITPGYKFKNVDSLVTNFHLPKSTLIMLVAAMVGSADETSRIYAHAIKNRYRFYSFGDAMLII